MNREIKFRAWDTVLKSMVPSFDNWIDFDGNYWTTPDVTHDTPNTEIVRGHNYILMQFTGLKDKSGKEIYEGDVVLGEQYYVPSDGYKRKKYPDAIKVICVVEFKRGSFQHPKLIGPAPEYKEAYEMYNYRGIGYWLEPTYKGSRSYNPESGAFDIPGDDQTCETIEVIGNIYQNPELIKQLSK